MRSPIVHFVELLVLVQLVAGTTPEGGIAIDLRRTTPDGHLYYAPVTIGQQEFKLLVSSATDDLLVVSNSTLAFGVRVESRTDYTYFGMGLRSNLAEYPAREVCLGSTCVGEQRVTNLVGSRTLRADNFLALGVDGLLGFQPNRYTDTRYGSLLERLLNQQRINRRLVSLLLDGGHDESGDIDQAVGTLILGATDERLYEGDIEYVPLKQLTKQGWFCDLLSVELDWSRARTSLARQPVSEKIEFLTDKDLFNLDSSSILFFGPLETLNKFHLEHMQAKLMGSLAGTYVFSDCSLDNKPDFVFDFGAYQLRVAPEDYVMKLESEPVEVCISAFKGLQSSRFTFGTRLMKKFYLVFDYDNGRLGLAKPRRQ